jgi:hypothetical protein
VNKDFLVAERKRKEEKLVSCKTYFSSGGNNVMLTAICD